MSSADCKILLKAPRNNISTQDYCWSSPCCATPAPRYLTVLQTFTATGCQGCILWGAQSASLHQYQWRDTLWEVLFSNSLQLSIPYSLSSAHSFQLLCLFFFSLPAENAECVQTDACWGQEFHSHGNQNIAINTVWARGDHSVIFIIFIKDALPLLMRTTSTDNLAATACLSLPRSPANDRNSDQRPHLVFPEDLQQPRSGAVGASWHGCTPPHLQGIHTQLWMHSNPCSSASHNRERAAKHQLWTS